MRFMRAQFVLMAALLFPASMWAQASKVAVVDFERAVVESVEGKKAAERFNTKMEERTKELQGLQKQLEDNQTKLRTGERALSDAVKADLTRQIDRLQTELTRKNEDAQKEMEGLRQELLQPIAGFASQLLTAYCQQQGYTVVVDISAPTSNVLYYSPENDITAGFVKTLDQEFAKRAQTPGQTPAQTPSPTPAPKPSTTAPAAPASPPTPAKP
jgi:outer membrane protein